jgi:hypothetical protein
VWVIPQQQQPPGQSFIGLISGFDNNVFTQQQHDAYDTTGNMYVWLAVADYDRILPSTIDQGFNFTLTNNSTYSGQFCEGQGLACFSLHPLTISESLTPFDSPSETPLPGALPLFATGLASLGVIGWRRKKSLAA